MPSDDEDEKEMEARFERETATAEEWVDVVVDVVGELEDLLDDGDGYDADDDADESKGGQSFRDAINALERRAIEGEDWDSDEHSLSQSALHGEFRKLVEDRLDSVLKEKNFGAEEFVDQLRKVDDSPGWSWARASTAEVVTLLRQCDDFGAWAEAMRRKAERRGHK